MLVGGRPHHQTYQTKMLRLARQVAATALSQRPACALGHGGRTFARAMSSSLSEKEGWAAFERAKELIDADEMEPAMGQLSTAARADIGEAQYLLGTLLLHDESDEEETGGGERDAEARALIHDAEENRQRSNDPEDARNLRDIRRSARKAYKQYLSAQAAKKQAAQEQAAAVAEASVVSHATTSQLDRAFGTTLQQFLDPKVKLAPLGEGSEEEANAAAQVDGTKAVEWIRRAAENSHRDAHVVLGNLCQSHDPPMAHAASVWYSRVASAKDSKPHPDALYNLGLMLFDGVEHAEPPFPANRTAAVPFFVRAAEAGDTAAQFFMGQLLHQGDEELGIAANLKSGLMLIEMAADKGHSGALYYLAQLYRSGDEDHELEPDHDKFLKYLDAALELLDDDALFCMADIYMHGSDGFEQDKEQAHNFYLAAAEQGNADAFLCLGTLYYNGDGVAQDFEKAFLYYQEAAERDSMQAWKNLAEMYATGRGVPRNENTAKSILKMLKKAEENGPQE